jgi:hypothetical protein
MADKISRGIINRVPEVLHKETWAGCHFSSLQCLSMEAEPPIPVRTQTRAAEIAQTNAVDQSSERWGPAISNSLPTATIQLSENPDSVNPSAAVNRESPRDFAILDGVRIRKRAILDADLAGRDERLGAAVNKKPQKTRDLNEKSRDSRLGFLCLPDWRSFAPKLKGSPNPTPLRNILSSAFSLSSCR